MKEPRDENAPEAGHEPPIQVEGGRDDGQSETTPEVVADRETQNDVTYDGWDDRAARDQENLPEDEQQG